MVRVCKILGLILALATVGLAAPADAQRAKPAEKERDPATLTDGLTYDEQLESLARIIGGAHYLRILCHGRGEQGWRTNMMRLMDLEAESGPRRTALAAAFNEGYQAEEARYDLCDARAEASGADLSAKGKRLADGLAARYRPQ